MPGTTSRVRRRLALELRRPLAWLRGSVATRRLRRSLASSSPSGDVGASADASIVMSFRAASADRIRILASVLRLLGDGFSTDAVPLVIADASPAEHRTEVADLLRTTGLPTDHREVDLPLAPALHEVLTGLRTPYFAFQLDDMWPVGLDEHYLRDSVTFLRRHRGRVDVVAPVIARATVVDAATRSVCVTAYERSGQRFRFGFGRAVRSVHVETVGAHTFGIFRNFLYGFFFNDLIAPTDDYNRRLRWYLENVSHDAHRIELAGRAWRGPVWHHIAVPLDGMSIIDLDYAHTGVGFRRDDPSASAVVDAIEDGWPMKPIVVSR